MSTMTLPGIDNLHGRNAKRHQVWRKKASRSQSSRAERCWGSVHIAPEYISASQLYRKQPVRLQRLEATRQVCP
ncbi:hypothetical protein PMI28_03610 [Pseudomonas sp. GM48]|nr:hypothetical protein PMI28_03610 [Pseudomonas sp. GM48]